MNGAVDYILSLGNGRTSTRLRWRIPAPPYIGTFDVRRVPARTQDGAWWHTVVAPDEAYAPGGGEQCVPARARKLVKVALPSPYLLGQRMWSEESLRSLSGAAFMEALVPSPRGTYSRAMRADIVQFDDRHCACSRTNACAQYADPQREIDLASTCSTRFSTASRRTHGDPPVPPQRPQRLSAKADTVRSSALGGSASITSWNSRSRRGDLSVLEELPETPCRTRLRRLPRRDHRFGGHDCRARREVLKHRRPNASCSIPTAASHPAAPPKFIDEAYAKLSNEAEHARRLGERFA